MDITTIKGVEICGVVACLPEMLEDNREACAEMYGDGIDTLLKATGINARCIAKKGTTALDLCVTAAQELLAQTKTAPEEIGAIINVTFTPEYIMPADAPGAQSRLGIPNNCMAFDVNMACSGYGYGMYLAGTLCQQLQKKVLVLDGDIQSAYVSREDKATFPVMGDVGTATLLQPSSNGDTWNFGFYTDGELRKVLYIPAGGSKEPTTEENLLLKEYDDRSKRKDINIYMDGFEIFKFVSITASRFIREFMQERGLTSDNIDIFVPHQANIYMITQLAKKLKIDVEKMWKSGDIYGNPSSASIPLTIAANATTWFKDGKGGKTLFSGFGGGLSISVAEISLNKVGYYGIVQY